MKSRIIAFFKFESVIVLLILVAFSLVWISWGKLIVHGWDLPTLYKKITKMSNTILFFKKGDAPHLAYFVYITPVLGLLSLYFLVNLKRRTANFILFITSFLGTATALYMYYYFFSSKMFKLTNAGAGVHLLCITCVVGLFYSLKHCRKKATLSDQLVESDTEAQPIADPEDQISANM